LAFSFLQNYPDTTAEVHGWRHSAYLGDESAGFVLPFRVSPYYP